ncbi:MAG TPA: lipocalin-like domain-containing protein, partial [Solirubrobacteraceae bacterium]
MSLGRRLAAAAVAGLVVVLGAAAFVTWRGPRPGVRATLSVAAALATEGGGFTRVTAPRVFEFPRDHGAHPGYRMEWWYVTGNVHDAEGRPFGFQVTFFRIALAALPAPRTSAWGTADVYMAHVALSDVATGRFRAVERFSRAAQGLAGAHVAPLRVWLDDWSLEGEDSAAPPGMRLRATTDAIGIDLALRSLKPIVLQGERGLSQKGPEAGNASYYYSLTRLRTAGTITVDGRAFAVEGASWMDREWGTSALGADQVGWDWFALQLDDGRDLMLYRLRRRDGSLDPFSSGTLVARDGTTTRLRAADASVEVLATWRSPRDGRVYPARWRVTVPAEGLDLAVTPRMADQELALA